MIFPRHLYSYPTFQTEKIKLEERKKHEEQDRFRLSKEKENSDLMVTELKQEMERKNKSYEQHYTLLEMKARETQAELEERIKEIEVLLQQSRQSAEEIKAVAESKAERWNTKELIYRNFLSSQQKALQVCIFCPVYVSFLPSSEMERHDRA